MYGNYLKSDDKMLKNLLLPKLISLNSVNFDYVECQFSDNMMQIKD